MNQPREQWASKLGFILAAAGSAIGLGNIWKFPYVAGENGGAAFIIIYLICILVIGLPVLISEILIGRTTQSNPVGAFRALSKNKFWISIGAMGVIAGFIILSFYSVVGGWSLGYIIEASSGVFSNFSDGNDANAHFVSLIGNPVWIISLHALFMTISVAIVLGGVQKGIEKGSKFLMPLLFIIMIVLVIRGLTLEGAEKGLDFILNPRWDQISAETVLVALGQAFFTLSLGMGAMLTYGSYISDSDNIFASGVQIVFLDTIIALLAGVAIFTAVFATGQNPGSGPGLIFQTLPLVFTKMPGGYLFSILFFLLLAIAAITSSISLLEVVVAYFVDEKGWSRKNAVLVFGGIIFILGIPCALSFNILSDFTLLGLTWFDMSDYVTSNLMLPLGGFFIAIFVAYFWGYQRALPNLRNGAEALFEKYSWIVTAWTIFLKYFSPVMILLVLLHSLGVF